MLGRFHLVLCVCCNCKLVRSRSVRWCLCSGLLPCRRNGWQAHPFQVRMLLRQQIQYVDGTWLLTDLLCFSYHLWRLRFLLQQLCWQTNNSIAVVQVLCFRQTYVSYHTTLHAHAHFTARTGARRRSLAALIRVFLLWLQSTFLWLATLTCLVNQWKAVCLWMHTLTISALATCSWLRCSSTIIAWTLETLLYVSLSLLVFVVFFVLAAAAAVVVVVAAVIVTAHWWIPQLKLQCNGSTVTMHECEGCDTCDCPSKCTTATGKSN